MMKASDSSMAGQPSAATTMKDFQIVKKLGEGAYSVVYRVKRLSDGQEYALKKVKMIKLTPKQKENALNQVRILASIRSFMPPLFQKNWFMFTRHPNIVAYKEAFFEEESQSLCIIMEYANGGDLYMKIVENTRRSQFFQQRDIWKYFIHMVRGLKSLHELKILHRDLKSANMFLTKEGVVKLGDLNVSKVAKKGLLYTQTGTPYYASPQVWKDQPYDWRSDIWSLGCVLYELVTLKPPFRAEGMQGLYRKVLKGVYPKIPSHYSSDLNALISSLLRVSPTMRPSCQQILDMPSVKEHMTMTMSEFDPTQLDLTPAGGLLNTIKLPRNLTILTSQLPEANYENSEPNKLTRNKSELPDMNPRSLRNHGGKTPLFRAKELQVIHEQNLPKSSHARSSSRQHNRNYSVDPAMHRPAHLKAPAYTPISRVGSQIVGSEGGVKLPKIASHRAIDGTGLPPLPRDRVGRRYEDSRLRVERSYDIHRSKDTGVSSLAGVYNYITPNRYHRVM